MKKEIVFVSICLICWLMAIHYESALLPYMIFVVQVFVAWFFFSRKDRCLHGRGNNALMPKHYSVDHSEDNWDMNKLNKRNTQCVDTGVHLDDYRILGQQLGFGICKATKLKWEHFDWVSLINESSHPIKKTKAYTFIGYRDERKAILLCEKIN